MSARIRLPQPTHLRLMLWSGLTLACLGATALAGRPGSGRQAAPVLTRPAGMPASRNPAGFQGRRRADSAQVFLPIIYQSEASLPNPSGTPTATPGGYPPPVTVTPPGTGTPYPGPATATPTPEPGGAPLHLWAPLVIRWMQASMANPTPVGSCGVPPGVCLRGR